MSVQVYDDDDGTDDEAKKFDLIGRSWIPLEEKWVLFEGKLSLRANMLIWFL